MSKWQQPGLFPPIAESAPTNTDIAESARIAPEFGPSPLSVGRLRIVPLTLASANQLVAIFHRHHKPVVGHRFSIGCEDSEGVLHGAAIVGRPVARNTDWLTVAEVTRLVTDGTKNACSMLYAASARVAREMGFRKIQTFILDEETGVSLRSAGWEFDGFSNGGTWARVARLRREDQPMGRKQRWVKGLS